MSDPPLLQLRDLSKRFGGVTALEGVSFEIAKGEIHALVGENGAGKSTLNRILAGVLRPDSGTMTLEGQPFAPASVPGAEAYGVRIVHQESIAFPDLDAADNLFLMREPTRLGGLLLDRPAMLAQTRAALSALGEDFALDWPADHLTLAQRQMVAIARAVSQPCRLLILDEPTASLSARETEALFRVIRRLRSEGASVLYVSHRLEEIFELADRVTILRDGRHVATQALAELDRKSLVAQMVGRAPLEGNPQPTGKEPGGSTGEVRLQAKGLRRAGAFEDVSLSLRAGEIVALAGLIGAGRSEVARAMFGLQPLDDGELEVNGSSGPRSPSDAIRLGMAYLPEDRQHEGLHLPLSVRENLTQTTLRSLSSAGWIRGAAERRQAQREVSRLGVKAPTLESPVQSLSGGNQQKVLFGKWLASEPTVLLLDEPTRGVDVGAKAEIHTLIREQAERGAAVLLISSELPEVLALADRVVVMRQGRIAGELSRATANESAILELALPKEERQDWEVAARRGLPREFGVLFLLGLMLVTAALANPSFLALENLRDMLVKVAPAMIVASGLTFVILAREIDISVGSLMGLCAATLGLVSSSDRVGGPAWLGVLLCLGVGVAGGLVNGLLTAVGRIPSIIVTLATLTLFSGVTELLLGGKWIQNLTGGLRAFGTGGLGPIPYSVLMAATIGLLAIGLSRKTAFGRRVFALGSNPEAAAAVGLPARRIRLLVFALSGLLCGVAALFGATQLQVIESGFGKGFELTVVAAVVVGGTSIRGGRGSVLGALIGAIALGIVGTLLIFLRLGESATYWERAIQGALILVAVLGEHFSRRRRSN